MSTVRATHETHALLTRYLDIANASLRANEDKAPWKQLFALGDRALGERRIGIAVYGEDPDRPHHYATLRFSDGRLHLLGEGGEAAGVNYWRVPKAHLEHVVSDPEPYIDNPLRMDLDWLRSRLDLQPQR